MQEIKVSTSKTYIVPTDAVSLTITHEWGDVIVDAAVVVPASTYSFTPDSIGVHEFKWRDAADSVVSTEHYSCYMPVVTSSEFFNENELLEAYSDDFAKIERLVRLMIQNYTGQRFGPYVGKTMVVEGDGGDSLELPVRIVALTGVLNNFGDDITELVQISPGSPDLLIKNSRFAGAYYHYLNDGYDVKRDIFWDRMNLFSRKYIFTVSGDWGWAYVPQEVSEAAKLLVQEFLGEDDIAEMRRKGVFETQLGDFSLRLNADQWGSTGNTAADNLLGAYVNMGIGLI